MRIYFGLNSLSKNTPKTKFLDIKTTYHEQIEIITYGNIPLKTLIHKIQYPNHS